MKKFEVLVTVLGKHGKKKSVDINNSASLECVLEDADAGIDIDNYDVRLNNSAETVSLDTVITADVKNIFISEKSKFFGR